MIIPFESDKGERWRIISDERQWMLQRYHVTKSGKSKGEERWETLGYHPDMAGAVSQAVRREIMLDPTEGLRECVEAVRRLSQRYGRLFPDVVVRPAVLEVE